MKKLAILCFWIVVMAAGSWAQSVDRLSAKSNPLLFEKLFLQIDRDFYAPGDKIMMKVFHVNGISNKLNSNYRNIYVQLIDERGTVVRRALLLSRDGEAEGSFNTTELPSGLYTIRAYTKYLENFGEEVFFYQKIRITDSSVLVDLSKEKSPDSSEIDLAFLPEGGRLILNAANTVAFKAIDSAGLGILVSGIIWKSSGEKVTTFATTYLGMGRFVLMPEENTTYFATVDQYPGLKISLPKPVSGVNLAFKEQGKYLFFRLYSDMKQPEHTWFYLAVSHRGVDLLQKKMEMSDFETTVSLEKALFPAGVTKVSLLDSALNPFAERLVFVDNECTDPVSLVLNKPSFGPRDSVHLKLESILKEGDSLVSDISVAVVNTNYLSGFDSRQTIRSYLLLDSELKGPLESPDSYFRNDPALSSAEKLDLLMLVHGWRSYLWNYIRETPPPPLKDWNDAGIDVSGTVQRILWKSPVSGATVSMDYVFRNFRIGETITDSAGRFSFKNIFLIDTLSVMLNTKTKHGNRNGEIILDSIRKSESEVSPGLFANMCFNPEVTLDFIRNNKFRRIKELEFNPEKGTILLGDVDIVGKKERAFSRSFGEYTWADKTLTVTPADYSFMYVFDYLEYNIPGLVHSNDLFEIGTKPIFFTIDGYDADYRELLTLRMKNIDVIDVLYPGFRQGFRMDTLGAVDMSGLIAIYMKVPFKPNIDYDFARGRIRPKIEGYQTTPVFYSPKYTLQNINSPKPDFRPTLFWNPNVSLKTGHAELSFYTADDQANYMIVAEGISKNGHICFGRATFTVAGKYEVKTPLNFGPTE